jgi:hypothetical protein
MPFPLRRGGLWREGPDGKWCRWNSKRQCWELVTVPLGPQDQHDSEEPLLEADKATEEFNADLEVFKVVVEHLRHNLTIYWQQADFFILIQGGLLTAYTALTSKDEDILQALGLFGIVLSVFWWWAAYGRWRLMNKWRDEVRSLDIAIDRHWAFYRVETAIKDNRGEKPFVPAFAGLFLPWLIVLLWIYVIFVLSPNLR